MNRAQALAEFATFGKHKDEAIRIIVASSNDEISSVHRLTLATVFNVLTRCLAGEIGLEDLELWANVIESRSDIDYNDVEGVIYALSNNEQMGGIDIEKIKKLIGLLKVAN